jgi:hypothetical protein
LKKTETERQGEHDGRFRTAARIETLLQEGNRLRGEAIALQKDSLEIQKSLVDETRANIVKAGKVNDQALDMQRRARMAAKVISVSYLFLLCTSAICCFLD